MTTSKPRVRLPARSWIDLAALTVLTAIGLLGFATAFQHGEYLVAAFGGLAAGIAAGLAATYLRLGPLLTALLAAIAFFLFGTAAALPSEGLFAVLPTLGSLEDLAFGAIYSWRDILTLWAPVGAPPYLAVLPYLICLIVGLVSASFAGRVFADRPRSAWPSFAALVAPLAVYVTSVLVGTDEPYFAAARGVAFGIIALVWMSWRPGSATGERSRTAVLRRRLIGVGIVAVVAAAVGVTAGAAAAPIESKRFVLRDEIVPPFDPLEYPSPLAAFRKYTNDLKDTVLFTVTGLHQDERVRLATMDAYDGRLWNVTAGTPGSDPSGIFRMVSGTWDHAAGVEGAGTPTKVTVQIVDKGFTGVWLPTVGYAYGIDFDQSTPIGTTSLRYNPSTGVAADTDGIDPGLTYTVLADEPTIPDAAALADVPVDDTVAPAQVEDVTQAVGGKLDELGLSSAASGGSGGTDASEAPYAVLTKIATSLSTEGYFSHGDTAAGEAKSPAGHGADRIEQLLGKSAMVGDDEQYAAAFALMATQLKYPARVVLGFEPQVTGGTTEVKGSDIHAWVEVAFRGIGWVSFDPTPPETQNNPPESDTKPKTEPEPQLPQPPQEHQEQDDLVATTQTRPSDDKKDEPFAVPAWVWGVGGSVLGLLLVLLVPLLVVGAIKTRRRAKRLGAAQPDRRAAGAWDELVDAYAELGYRAPRRATRLQLALDFEQQFRTELAERAADRAGRSRRRGAAGEDGRVPTPGGLPEPTAIPTSDAMAWRPGVAGANDPDAVLPGLRELAVEVDAVVFSGVDPQDALVTRLWTESRDGVKAAAESVGRFRRLLSRYRLRSRTDAAASLAARITAATTRVGEEAVVR